MVDVEPMSTPNAPLVAASCAAWTVKVVEGPDHGQTWRIDDIATRRVLIGRGPACELRLSDPAVSRRHAALEHDDGGLRVVDLDSSEGTWLGRTRVRDVYLGGGEVIQLGTTKLSFETDGVEKELALSSASSFGDAVGVSAQMRALYPALERLARTELPVLIEGETGTGKQLVAEALHSQSSRKDAPFVVLDCRPGATMDRDVFEEASRGTLFLDEIGDLNIALQVKLLRILEGGGPRVLGATRRDLDREVQAGRFRDDLLHRLAVTRVELPPLRKRAGDIAFLARHFLLQDGGDPATLTSDLGARLAAYDWPGNVRELKSAIAQLVELVDGQSRPAPKEPEAANDFLDGVVTSGMTFPSARDKIVEEFTRRYVEHMLQLHGGNVTRAAAASGIGRRYFQMVRGKAG
ncbi:MAG: sigma 54-interacting transcriptional regulator [Labilithrix sp.]